MGYIFFIQYIGYNPLSSLFIYKLSLSLIG